MGISYNNDTLPYSERILFTSIFFVFKLYLKLPYVSATGCPV